MLWRLLIQPDLGITLMEGNVNEEVREENMKQEDQRKQHARR